MSVLKDFPCILYKAAKRSISLPTVFFYVVLMVVMFFVLE